MSGFGLMTVGALPLRVLTLVIVQLLHPGADPRAVEAIAAHARTPLEAAEVAVYMEHESRFGEALSGRRWDARAYGDLQIRDRPDLEHDPDRSVVAWLRIKDRAAAACGDERALAGLSSGACDRGTRLAEERKAEARWILMVAQAVAR